jgi:hypothetical protein
LIFAAAGFTSVTSATITVNPAGTTTQIISDEPEPSLSGELVAVDFEVVSPAGAPTGTVVVTASGGPETCSVDVAVGQCSIILTEPGDRTLTASFQGSTLFNASLDATPHRVDVPSVPPTAGNDGTGP